MTMLTSFCTMISFWAMSFQNYALLAPSSRVFASLQCKMLKIVLSAVLGLLFFVQWYLF